MIYLRPRRRQKKIPRIVLVAGIILVGLLLLRPIMPEFLSSGIHAIGAFVWERESRLTSGINFISTGLQTKKSLVEENTSLREEIVKLRLSSSTIGAIERENMDLKSALSRDYERERIVASVLVRPSRTPYDILVVDRGREEGVIERSLVFAYNSPIGWVKDVYTHTSVVELFSTPGRKVDVRLGGTDTATIATGQGNGNFIIELPRDIMVEQGALVSIPRNSPSVIGIVAEVRSAPSDSLQTIFFRLPINLNELWLVDIVSGEQLPFSL
jgi:cell shape-determining protein MreC